MVRRVKVWRALPTGPKPTNDCLSVCTGVTFPWSHERPRSGRAPVSGNSEWVSRYKWVCVLMTPGYQRAYNGESRGPRSRIAVGEDDCG